MKARIIAIVTLIFLVFFVISRWPNMLLIHSAGGLQTVHIEIADTDEQRRMGLMHRGYLKEGHGMVFLYAPDSSPFMWMKNMLISLDILFVGHDFRISHIESDVPPCRESDDSVCPRYSSSEASSMVVEVPAGYVKRHGIQVGDVVELHL